KLVERRPEQEVGREPLSRDEDFLLDLFEDLLDRATSREESAPLLVQLRRGAPREVIHAAIAASEEAQRVAARRSAEAPAPGEAAPGPPPPPPPPPPPRPRPAAPPPPGRADFPPVGAHHAWTRQGAPLRQAHRSGASERPGDVRSEHPYRAGPAGALRPDAGLELPRRARPLPRPLAPGLNAETAARVHPGDRGGAGGQHPAADRRGRRPAQPGRGPP